MMKSNLNAYQVHDVSNYWKYMKSLDEKYQQITEVISVLQTPNLGIFYFHNPSYTYILKLGPVIPINKLSHFVIERFCFDLPQK